MLVMQITSPVLEDALELSEALAEQAKSYRKAVLGDDGARNRLQISGPTEAAISRVNDIYRRVIYIKDEEYDSLIGLKDMAEKFLLEHPIGRQSYVWFDFDPMNGF